MPRIWLIIWWSAAFRFAMPMESQGESFGIAVAKGCRIEELSLKELEGFSSKIDKRRL